MRRQLFDSIVVISISILVAVAAGACGKGKEGEKKGTETPAQGTETPAKGTETPAAPAAASTLTVRGQVTALPAAAGDKISIHHEAMPDFVNAKGEKKGMMSMTMPFAVDKDVSLEGVAVGDKIEFKLNVDWSRTPPLLITGVSKLPADTALQLAGH